MIYKKDGELFDIYKAHLINDVNYPSNWFQNEENRIAFGIEEFPDPEPTREEIVNAYEKVITMHLNLKAIFLGYDDINSACSYAGIDNPYRAESERFIVWRAACWAYFYALVELPSDGDILISQLPVF